jgi:GTP-binding protein LepA
MKEQLLDQMDLERERGITIKLAPVRMFWSPKHSQKSKVESPKSSEEVENLKLKIENSDSTYMLNLIDTPGHVDFSYEVSRSLAAVEGAILLVDAAQGIEAQTLSTLYAALENDLKIIPVVNKIDLPAAQPEVVCEEIIHLLGCAKEDIIYASGKTGQGVEEILDQIIERIPAPTGGVDEPVKALVFDSTYDPYRGVVAYLRMVTGQIKKDDEFILMETKSSGRVEETGIFTPKLKASTPLSAGEIGYLVTGFRSVGEASVGDTLTLKYRMADSPLPGYKKVKPFVYASIFSVDRDKYVELKQAVEKLKLNDASLEYEPEQSEMLGHGFRCGFLGLLHLDIVKERLEREFDLDLIVTSPTVVYTVINMDGSSEFIGRPSDFKPASFYQKILEPWVTLEVITPKEFIGEVMELSQNKRAVYANTEYIDEDRLILKYRMPLSELIVGYYDQLKSVTRGYASINYEFSDYQETKLEKIDILIAGEKVDALSFVIFEPKAQRESKRIVERLKELIPKQNFEIKLQAAIGANIIASERISAMRKDVIAKLYGGDVTRKNKLLDKQKKGKKKMKQIGKVNIPSDVFIKVLKNSE